MSARDIFHNLVKLALQKDGWTITHDPLTLKIGRRSPMVDLGAEKLLAAEKEQEKIAVEIQSFLNPSPLKDLENALGQFILYSKILSQNEPDRTLYLAVNRPVFNEIFSEEVGQLLLETTELRLIVFNSKTDEVIKWIT